MIIHSQIFDYKSKRSMADFTLSLQENSSMSPDDFPSECERLFKKGYSDYHTMC